MIPPPLHVPGRSPGQTPERGAPHGCRQALTAEQVQRIFNELKSVSGRDGCKLEDVSTKRSITNIIWSHNGEKLPPALLAPRGCLATHDLDGAQLQASVPAGVRKSCRTAYATLDGLVGRRVGTLVTQQNSDVPPSAIAVPATVCVFVLLPLLALAVGIQTFRRRPQLGSEGRRFLLLGAFAFLLALVLRLFVEPSLANWYTIVLPASGAMGGRFGPGWVVLQRALSIAVPWTDTTLFSANIVIGAFAVALSVGIARERRMPAAAAGALAVLFALAPLHVRISASPSAHVLASTLALAALWLWLRAQRLGSKLHAALALLLMAAAVLTRAEIWVQLGAIGLWAALRDPQEQAAGASRRLRFALTFAGAWALLGAFAYFAIVVPSHHPAPDTQGMRRAASQLLAQYWDVAFSSPHWVSPLAVLLALPGVVYVLVYRWRLLAGIVLFLVMAFVPLGRTLQHDGLLGARYFLATLPLFLMLPAYGLHACAQGLVRALRRVPRLSGAARLQPTATTLLLLAIGFGDWALSVPAYRARYAFQDEYDFLRVALARVPDGCTVASVPVRSVHYHRDLDCCLDPDHSPLSLAYPRLRFARLDKPGDIEGPGCRYYYESSLCSIDLPQAQISAVDRPALDFIRRACDQARRAPLFPVATTRVSSRSTNGYFVRGAPEVRLFRVGPGSRQP